MNSSENPAPVAASGADTSAASVPPPAAGEGAAPPLSGDVAKLEAELAQARKEAADHYDRYVRMMADFENARKRTIREKEELRQFAAARVLEDLIPVLDSLALAMSAAKAPGRVSASTCRCRRVPARALTRRRGIASCCPRCGRIVLS